MTAEHRHRIRTERDAAQRRSLNRAGLYLALDVPLAEHLPPIDQRGADLRTAIEAKRERRRHAESLEALAA